MKVRMLVTITGTRDGKYWPSVGEVVDLPAAAAAKLVAAGHVEPADAPARKRRRGKVPASVVLDEPETLAEADEWRPAGG